MPFSLRVIAVGAATFAFVAMVVTCLVPLVAARVATGSARRRAHRLGLLRLVPAAMAATAGLLVTASFLDFEPRRDEYIGWLIPAVGVLGMLFIAAAVWRALQMGLATRRLTRDWLARGEPIALEGVTVPSLAISSTFPVVAVVGVRHPRLVIARSVLQACTADELRAVLAHEQGHIDRQDNLRRLLMYAAPDALAWLPFSSRLASAWRAATEEAADDEAARAGEEGRLALASALVKVARLAAGARPAGLLPVSALYCGENLDGRVRRLLEPGDAYAAALRARRPILTAGALAGILALAFFTLRLVQSLIEAAIQRLP